MALDKKINELQEALSLSGETLIIVGSAADGRIFKTKLSDLVAFLAYPQNKLAPPALSIEVPVPTTLVLNLNGDSRTATFVIRLATDSAFTANVRMATVTAPQSSYQFTGLTPGTTYWIEVVARSAGILESVAKVVAFPLPSLVLGFPFNFPISF